MYHQLLLFASAIAPIILQLPPTASLSTSPPTQKIALVTGANKGIGKEIARRLGDPTSNTLCLLGCRNKALGRATAKELQSSGQCPNVEFLPLDLDSADSIHAAREHIQTLYQRLDILVNNAAVCFNDPTLYGRVAYTPFEGQAEITTRTNFFGTWDVIQAMFPLLEASSSPRMINIASSAGRLAILPSQAKRDFISSQELTVEQLQAFVREFVSDVKAGTHVEKGWPNTAYGVSKVALIALTKVLAREHPQLMVNSVDPGYCATDQNNNQGFRPAARGAVTPYLLAMVDEEEEGGSGFLSGLHWFDESPIEW